jgi:hypothetical protein
MCDVKRTLFLFSLACVAFTIAVPCYGGGKSESSSGSRPEKKGGVQAGNSINIRPAPHGGVPHSGLTFIGVSGKLSKREDTVKAAFEDAARKLSFFYSVSGYSFKRERIGSETLDFNIDSEYRLEYDSNLEKYVKELEYDPNNDVLENNNNNVIFVIARAARGTAMPDVRGHSFGKERPWWVDAPPLNIGGFVSGVGFSGRLSSHSDAVVRSYEKAAVAIIENMGSRVSGIRQNYQNSYSAFGFDMVSSNETSASGSLKNFYVIESWTDPANLSVWTLAVASGNGS